MVGTTTAPSPLDAVGSGDRATKADLQLAFAGLRTEIRRAVNRMMIAEVVVGGLVVAAVKYLP